MSGVAALLLVWAVGVVAWDPFGLAPTPPMGFANWNGFGCDYNDSTIRGIADALVSTGMRDAGYKVVLIQECITRKGHRDAQGVPQPDPVKFPHGMKDLVAYIHSKGLLAGIYTDVGPMTCAQFEGSYGHEEIDALTYAEWGIDFVEQDSCFKPTNHSYHELYLRMHSAILKAYNATGHKMMFYMCVQGQDNVYQWGPSVGTLWRTTGDICAPKKASWGGMLRNFRGDTLHPNSTQIGGWQDPDMLVVGMAGLSSLEWRTHFSLWSMAAAPLWAGIDLRYVSHEALSIFLNKEVIAVDQDRLGLMARQVASSSGEVWVKPLAPADGERAAAAVMFFNPSDTATATITVQLSDIAGMKAGCQVRDLWEHKDLGTASGSITREGILPHDSVLLRLSA